MSKWKKTLLVNAGGVIGIAISLFIVPGPDILMVVAGRCGRRADGAQLCFLHLETDKPKRF